MSRYYMDTLLGTGSLRLGAPIRDMRELSLALDVPAWTVSGPDLERVVNWLDAAAAELRAPAEGGAHIEAPSPGEGALEPDRHCRGVGAGQVGAAPGFTACAR